jgi:hypothetical protein
MCSSRLAASVTSIGGSAAMIAGFPKHISAVQSNLIAVIEPVFNPVWVFFVLGEAPGITALIGGCIIIGAVTMASIGQCAMAGRNRRPQQDCMQRIGPGIIDSYYAELDYIIKKGFCRESDIVLHLFLIEQ